jgi:hypothetical protein
MLNRTPFNATGLLLFLPQLGDGVDLPSFSPSSVGPERHQFFYDDSETKTISWKLYSSIQYFLQYLLCVKLSKVFSWL